MQHIAIDLGSRESQICIRQADGTIVAEGKHETERLGSYLQGRPASRVILETCAEAFFVAEQAQAAGHDVRVVPATLVKTLGVGARRIKTDRRDARTLSEVSCRIELPSVHLRSRASRELISMYRARDALVESRTKAVNGVRGWLRTLNLHLRKRNTQAFPNHARELLAEQSIEVPRFVQRSLETIEHLNEHIVEATKELRCIATSHTTCRLLMTTPGVGAITAVRFMAALDEIGRFSGAHAVQAYLGLTPGENSSSGRKQRLSITRAGPPDVRKLLVQAAWTTWRTAPQEPIVRWAERVAERRGRKIAVVALARRLAGILFAIWRDGRPYDGSQPVRDSQHPRPRELKPAAVAEHIPVGGL